MLVDFKERGRDEGREGERERERERERKKQGHLCDRDTNQLSVTGALTGDRTGNLGLCPDQE